MSAPSQDLFEALTAITAVATLPLMILSFIFLGWQIGLLVMLVGWFLLVPVFAILSDVGTSAEDEATTRERERLESTSSHGSDDERDGTDDPLETLRDRYARGELDDEEFERQLEVLLETDEGDPERFLERRRREETRERESEFDL